MANGKVCGGKALIADETIKQEASSDAVYNRGLRYFRNGYILSLKKSEDGLYYAGTVRGSGNVQYDVSVELTNDGSNIERCDCSCPAFWDYPGACKHVVALLKAIQFDQARTARTRMEIQRYKRGKQLLELFIQQAEKNAMPVEKLHLVPSLVTIYDGATITNGLQMRIGADRMYVVKSIKSLMQAASEGSQIVFGKGLQIDFGNRIQVFDDELSKGLWKLLLDAYDDEESLNTHSDLFPASYGYGYYKVHSSTIYSRRIMKLSRPRLERFLDIVGDNGIKYVVNDTVEDIYVKKGLPPIEVKVGAEKNGGILTMENAVSPLTDDYGIVYCDGVIYRVPEKGRSILAPLMMTMSDERLDFDQDTMGKFLGTVLPRLETVASVDIAPDIMEQYAIETFEPSVYIDYYKDGIAARPVYKYGDISFNPLVTPTPEIPKDHPALIRNETDERAIENIFSSYGFERDGDRLIQPDEKKTFEFLDEGLPVLSNIADVYYSEVFRKRPVQRISGLTVGVSVNDHNLLDVSIENQEFDFDELVGILGAYRKKSRYFRLKDGSFVTLESQQLGLLSDLVETTGIEEQLKKGKAAEKVELPLSSALYIDSLAREADGLNLKRSRGFKTLIRDIRDPENADVEVPKELDGVMRDYQVTGYSWLTMLARNGLGGILADDMGLGKTLQVIAFLLGQKKNGETEPALVVTPTSLMYNWMEEIERFTPDLKATAVAGTKQERIKILEDKKDTDVFITTYNMLKRDVKEYENHEFSCCFLDEAQQIKNPSTQNAKSVKSIRARGRFALTGTPIENTLTELWSIFDFLMPGYLSGHKKFRQLYESPIIRMEDAHAKSDLVRHISPFVLRRMKKDVLKELPDKTERRMINQMTPKQAKVYAAYFVQGKKEFAKELAAHGFQGSRMKILAILTRLRQIACDPSLFLENYDGGSGKLDQLQEIVCDAVEGGHRILIFSQFTTMLSHIRNRLEQSDIGYMYLDGSTPPAERMRLVNLFNKGSVPVFLISLKAGGTGLNLIGADMVIHYDPWWNPAVEDQATDRAYRIGQKNNVQVLKLITKNTIEERIYELQQRKKALIDQMIQPGETFLSKLTDQEIMDLFQN